MPFYLRSFSTHKFTADSDNVLPNSWSHPLPPHQTPELPPSNSIFATSNDDISALQVATSLLLTGAISVFLFKPSKTTGTDVGLSGPLER